jgi:hypothetical protein
MAKYEDHPFKEALKTFGVASIVVLGGAALLGAGIELAA